MRNLLLLLVLAIQLLPASAMAQQQVGINLAIQAGFAGAYRAGEWFPVVVDITNDGADARGVLEWQLPGQRNEQVFRYPVDVPRGAQKRVVLSAFSRGFARSGEVRFIDTSTVVLAEGTVTLEPIDADQFVIGVISSDPTLLNSLASLTLIGANGTMVRHLQLSDLPEQALALRSLNVLFIHDANTSALTARQQEAIRLWVAIGGQLILSGGLATQTNIGGVADILPAEIGASVTEGDLGALLQLGTQPLPSGATRAPLNELRPRTGAIDTSNGGALIFRQAYGVGRVSVAAFDFAILRGWQDEPSVWANVIEPIALFSPGIGSRTNQISLLQTALQLPGLGLPPVGALALFLLGYILVIGPLNYFILRRLRRLEWAWLSVPVIVTLFAGGLYLVGFGVRGNQSQVSQVTIVQATEGQQQALATGFIALFSPRREAYTVGFPAETLIHETRSFDDLSTRIIPVDVTEQSTEVRDMLVDIASVRTLVGEAPINYDPLIASRTEFNNGAPRGEIRNTGALTLDNVMVVRGRSFVALGDLAPGATASFDFSASGSTFPWGVNVPETGVFNRKTLINSLFNEDVTLFSSNNGPLGSDQTYLLAWNDRPSLAVRINNFPQTQSGHTLYVIRLRE
jgi:hypothetical protein